MKATKDKVENHQAYLTIEIEPDEVEKSMDKAYKRLVQKAKIPGFRKGKAPRLIFEKYVGRDAIFEDALEHLIPEVYEQAVKEQGLEAVAEPEFEVTQKEPPIFKAIVPLKPIVELGDYRNIKAERIPTVINESSVNDVIEQLRHQHSTWEPVGRPVDFEDLVVFDIDSTVEGQTFIKQEGAQFQLIKGQAFPIPGFSEQIVGMKKGEEKEFKLPLPEDYQRKEYAGKDVSLKVKVKEVKVEKLPEINDDLARAVSPDLLTVAALREQAEKELRSRADERNRLDFEEKAIDAVVAVSKVEYPPVYIESEINRILNQRFENKREALESYLKTMNKTEQELRDELRPSAITGVSRSLVLNQVAKDGKVEVTNGDIDDEIEKMIKDSTQKKEDLLKFFNSSSVRDSIQQTLYSRRTIKILTDIAEANAPKSDAEPKESKSGKETKKPAKSKAEKEEK